MSKFRRITTPDDPSFDTLCESLRSTSERADQAWPADALAACAESGVFEWFVPPGLGGQGWSPTDVIRGYLRLSASCLTTTFIITQLTGAVRRIANSENQALANRLMPDLMSGQALATLGISHLTTSRQHLKKPALLASKSPEGFRLNGFTPWATGAAQAEYIVIGASLEDGRQ